VQTSKATEAEVGVVECHPPLSPLASHFCFLPVLCHPTFTHTRAHTCTHTQTRTHTCAQTHKHTPIHPHPHT
jgi:hypothetical protein